MGHVGVKGLKTSATGLDFDTSTTTNCRVCALANIKHLPFPNTFYTRATKLLHRIHTDICGPLPTGYGGFQYFILFIDDFSRWIAVYFLKNRDTALDMFKEYRAAVEKFTGNSIIFLRCDNAPEYVKGKFEIYCKSEGIQYEKTVPHSPPQNGVSERTNYTIGCMTRAMLLDAELPAFFWVLAVLAAVHIKNRVPSAALLSNTSPFEIWFKQKPDLSHLRPFGCHVVSRRLTNESIPKFDARGENGRFVGYARNAKGYLVYFPHNKRVLVRRDIKFLDMPSPELSTSTLSWKDVPVDTTTQFGLQNFDTNESRLVALEPVAKLPVQTEQ